MNSTRIIAVTITSLLLLASSAFADRKADDIIKKMQKKYKGLKSLQADFEREVVWELAGETRTVKGSLYLTSDDKYRIETDEQLVVTDGKKVWTFSHLQNYVLVDHLDKSKGGQLPRDILLQYANLYNSEYLGEEKLDGNKVYVLKLLPKDEEELIVSMKVWVDADKLYTRKIEQVDINENINRYMVSNVKENIELDDSLFYFVVPDGAEVVDMTEAE